MHKAGPVRSTSELIQIPLSLTFLYSVRRSLGKQFSKPMTFQFSRVS